VIPIQSALEWLRIWSVGADLGPVKIRDVIRLLEEDGWLLVRVRGSHRQFQHLVKPGTVTVAGHPSMDLARGTLKSILKQGGLEKRR